MFRRYWSRESDGSHNKKQFCNKSTGTQLSQYVVRPGMQGAGDKSDLIPKSNLSRNAVSILQAVRYGDVKLAER